MRPYSEEIFHMTDILIFAEQTDGKIKKTSLELVSKAQQLGANVLAVVIGSADAGLADQLAAYGAKKVLLANPELTSYNTIAYAAVLAEAVSHFKPTILLGSASAVGKDLFPRVSAKIKAGLASDATDIRLEGDKLIAKKPVYSGKGFVEVKFNTPIQMVTTRPNSFTPSAPDNSAKAEVIPMKVDVGTLRGVLKETVQGVVGKADLTEAEIIVSGGRAMANSDNFKVLHALGDVIGATVGASRAAVDSGFATHDMQVGQTGKVVNPKLYIACGISGAIQHLAGMRTSKVIVAINKDPEAPIFSKADYGIVGDLFTVVPLLTEEFKKAMAD